jgi:two-component system, cell cycle sensor histidine kinase and response regulator CckA
VHRAAALTRQLLAYARQQVIAPALVDVNDAIRGLDGLLRRSISENVVIELRLAERLPPVLIDRGQLEQVVVNLVVNARDAMPAGGYLAIETRLEAVDAVRATILDAARGEHVAIRVSDTGVGIAPDVLPNIFEPFYSTKGPGAGTGLGLATVDGIVRQARGAIDVTSSEGVGTTFLVLLPRAEGMPLPAAAEPRPRLEPGGQRETIVVCEDDPAVRAIVVRALERHEFRVLAFAESEAALAHVRREAPDVALLVTDVVMPEMAGPELAAAMRERVPGLRVLYLSGYAEAMLATHGVLDEGVELLTKPFTPDTLVQRVREAIA